MQADRVWLVYESVIAPTGKQLKAARSIHSRDEEDVAAATTRQLTHDEPGHVFMYELFPIHVVR